MTTYSYDFPLPPRQCTPNSGKPDARGVWRAAYRKECFYEARKAQGEGKLPRNVVDRARIVLWFQLEPRKRDGRYRPDDADNAKASSKGLIDALKDAGVIRGDTWADLQDGGSDLLPYHADDKPFVRVILEIE